MIRPRALCVFSQCQVYGQDSSVSSLAPPQGGQVIFLKGILRSAQTPPSGLGKLQVSRVRAVCKARFPAPGPFPAISDRSGTDGRPSKETLSGDCAIPHEFLALRKPASPGSEESTI